MLLVHPKQESTLNLQPSLQAQFGWALAGTAQVFCPPPIFQYLGNAKFEKGKIKESVFLITLFSGKKKKKIQIFLY
jgi:hypothetical protein